MADEKKIAIAPFSTIALRIHKVKPNFVAMLYRELPVDCEDADKWIEETAKPTWPEMFEPEVDADAVAAAAAATNGTPTPSDEENAAALTNLTARGRYSKKFGQPALDALLKANSVKPSTIISADALAAAGVKQPGTEKQQHNEDGDDVRAKECRNVYSDAWKGTPEQRQAKIASMIRGLGTATVAKIAAAQNKRIDGSELRK